jgi:hypothetical protein
MHTTSLRRGSVRALILNMLMTSSSMVGGCKSQPVVTVRDRTIAEATGYGGPGAVPAQKRAVPLRAWAEPPGSHERPDAC